VPGAAGSAGRLDGGAVVDEQLREALEELANGDGDADV
jgi:hypothetical protein